MFIEVKLLNGFQKPLLYKIATIDTPSIKVGTIVQVPLNNRVVPALIEAMYTKRPDNSSFVIREIHGLEPFPQDNGYMTFINQLSNYHQIKSIQIIKRLHHFMSQSSTEKTVVAPPLLPMDTTHTQAILTAEQTAAYTFVAERIQKGQYTPTLLHGVTGSGKTEVYKKLLLEALAHHKSALFLLPEVSLALAFVQRLTQELPPNTPLYSFHSASPRAEKKMVWQLLHTQQPIIIIGVHLPVLLPIAHLGLIIVDEEHEPGYQEKKHPKIHTKDAAIWRAQLTNIPIVLGSATPSFQTLYNTHYKGWHSFTLSTRFSGAFPTLKVVLLTDKTARPSFWITRELYAAIQDRLIKKEQTILFLNRRGYSFFIQCNSCSFVFSCPNCSVSLTLHDDHYLNCHYCTYRCKEPIVCSSCPAAEGSLLKKGIGTQQLMSIVQKLFPTARIARADLDSTKQKKGWHTTITTMHNKEIDILIGTQTITKGYDFHGVTLVGIIWADLNLNFPIFNAAETALQQLIQVAGRAGRYHKASTVIVQSMTHNPLFNYLNEQTYPDFFTESIKIRALLGYPPCQRLVEIELKYYLEKVVEHEALTIQKMLVFAKKRFNVNVQILGPAKPILHKIQGLHMRKIYLKALSMKDITLLYNSLNRTTYKSMLFFTPNPLS